MTFVVVKEQGSHDWGESEVHAGLGASREAGGPGDAYARTSTTMSNVIACMHVR